MKFSDIHCSAGNTANFTDPPLNLTVLSALQLKHLPKLLREAKLPDICLPTFIHEATHHWCFQSPVVSTLAYLQLRARRRAKMLEDMPSVSSDISPYDVLEDVIRYETAIAMLRPIAEGLALFAEFDAFYRNSPVIALPLMWTYYFFIGHDKSEIELKSKIDNFRQSLNELLWKYRVGKECCEQKAGLLAHPMSTINKVYLPGYLTVKNLWHEAVSRCERFQDTNLFLTYLRGFFYDDLGLVAVLLDQQMYEFNSANSICMYLQNRFKQFLKCDLDAYVAAYENEVSARGKSSFPYGSQKHFTQPNLYQLGQQSLQALLFEVVTDSDDCLIWIISRRELMSLCSFQVPVRVSSGTTFVTLNNTIMSGVTTLPNVEDGEGEGSIDYVISPSGGYQAFTISLSGKLVSVVFGGIVDEDKRNVFTKYQINRSFIQKEAQVFKEALDNVLHDPRVEYIHNHITREVAGVVKAYYRGLSLALVPDDRLDHCFNLMSKYGFYGILNRRSSLVRILASLSVYYSNCIPKDLVLQVLAEEGIEYESAIADLIYLGKQSGFPMIEDREKDFICYV